MVVVVVVTGDGWLDAPGDAHTYTGEGAVKPTSAEDNTTSSFSPPGCPLSIGKM